VDVVVQGQDTMSGQFDIRPGGQLVIPLLGSVQAAGRKPEQLAADIARKLHGLLAKPQVTVVIAVRPPRTVTVLGEVRNPGSYDSPRELGVLDAIARAGGLTPFADRDGVFVIRRGNPPQRIRFRFDDLATADGRSLDFELQDGDAVIVE
jgi:polysaccharide export outer membrane protein